jgi:hypothetical protein
LGIVIAWGEQEFEIRDGLWSGPDETLVEILDDQADIAFVHAGDPYPDLTIARDAQETFPDILIRHIDPQPVDNTLPPGTVY